VVVLVALSYRLVRIARPSPPLVALALAVLLDAAVLNRIQASQTVVVAIEGFEPAERERYVRMAHAERRPRHLILLETSRDHVQDEERAGLDELRRALDAGELGSEGFQTALRLGGNTLAEVKRIVFQRPPRDD